MTIQQSNYSVRTMTRQELTIAMDWAAVDLVHRHNMIPAFETVRMYRGVGPDLPTNRIFGVTTFELG